MKYKIGDIVKVRDDLVVGEYFNISTFFSKEMKRYMGKSVEIIAYYYDTHGYLIKEDNCSSCWADEMFE